MNPEEIDQLINEFDINMRRTANLLNDYSIECNNLEERLAQIDDIIDSIGQLDNQIQSMNVCAEETNNEYRKFVCCSEGQNNDLFNLFHSDNVENDNNLRETYSFCMQERQRICSAIEDINARINYANAQIEYLGNEIRRLRYLQG